MKMRNMNRDMIPRFPNVGENVGIWRGFSFADAHCKVLILAELLDMKANIFPLGVIPKIVLLWICFSSEKDVGNVLLLENKTLMIQHKLALFKLCQK